MAEWRGVHVNDSDMLRMQQEAIRRVRQMQQRARRSVEGEPIDVEYQPVPSAPEPEPIPAPPFSAVTPPFTEAAFSAGPAPEENNVPGEAPPREGTSSGTSRQDPFPGNRGTAPPGTSSPSGSPFSGSGPFAGLGSLGEKLSGLFGGASSGGHGSVLGEFLGEDSPIAKVLEALHIDSERLLLIGLLLVLLNEKADRTLLLALVYLLL